MKICIVGAGAIGGLLGARLAVAGDEVTLIARGPHLEAIRARGLEVTMNDGAVVHATEIAATGGHEGVRSARIWSSSGSRLTRSLRLPARSPCVVRPRHHRADDPERNPVVVLPAPRRAARRHRARLSRPWRRQFPAAIAPERIVGCIAYPGSGNLPHRVESAILKERRFPVGELDGSTTRPGARVVRDAAARRVQGARARGHPLPRSGSRCGETSRSIPISALTHSTLVDICRFPPSRELAATNDDGGAGGRRRSSGFRSGCRSRNASRGRSASASTRPRCCRTPKSGKALETEALIGAVVELGRLTGTPTPAIDAVCAMTRSARARHRRGTGPDQGGAARDRRLQAVPVRREWRRTAAVDSRRSTDSVPFSDCRVRSYPSTHAASAAVNRRNLRARLGAMADPHGLDPRRRRAFGVVDATRFATSVLPARAPASVDASFRRYFRVSAGSRTCGWQWMHRRRWRTAGHSSPSWVCCARAGVNAPAAACGRRRPRLPAARRSRLASAFWT